MLFYTSLPTVFLIGPVFVFVLLQIIKEAAERGDGLGGERGYLWGRVGMLLQLFWSTTSHLKAIIIIISTRAGFGGDGRRRKAVPVEGTECPQPAANSEDFHKKQV